MASTRIRRAILGCFIAVPVAVTVGFLSCEPAAEVSVQPPKRTAAEIGPEFQVVFNDSGERIRTPQGTGLIRHGAYSDPVVLHVNGRYAMWFTSLRKAHSKLQVMGTAYAESPDGMVWTPRLDADGDPQLVLQPDPSGWDAGGVETPSVVRTSDGKYLLYYTGDFLPKGSHRWAIGLATSNDGLNWTKYGGGPVLESDGGWEGPFRDGKKMIGGVLEPSVLWDPDRRQFQMWYSALGMKGSAIAFRVGYATSTDGRAWKKRSDPVMEPERTGAWDDAVVSHINVVRDPRGGYHMFYFGTSASVFTYSERKGAAMIAGNIGHAYSVDGLVWKRDSNPVVSTAAGTWQAWMVGGPTALIENGRLRLWYFGSAAHNKYEFGIAHLTGTIGRPR